MNERIKFKTGDGRNYSIFPGFAHFVPGVWDLLMLFLSFVIGLLFGSAVILIVYQLFGEEAMMEYCNLISYPISFLLVFMYANLASKNRFLRKDAVSLDSNNFGHMSGFTAAVLVSVAMVCAAFVTDIFSYMMPEMPDHIVKAMESLTKGNLIINLLCVSVMAPILEEWFCRGMVLRGLLYSKRKNGKRLASPAVAILISALVFAVMHFNIWQAVPAFLLGCLLGYIYYRTGSLKLTILMHCVNNTFALIFSRVEAFDDKMYWIEVLGPVQYWLLFALGILVLVIVLREFSKMQLQSPSGNCDAITAEI